MPPILLVGAHVFQSAAADGPPAANKKIRARIRAVPEGGGYEISAKSGGYLITGR
jgi:hypothetical protein